MRRLVRIKKFRIAILIGFIGVLAACSSIYTATGTRWNLGSIYNPTSSHFHPSYRVYHNSNHSSLLLIKLFPSELLFNPAFGTGEFEAEVSMDVKTYEIVKRKPRLVDSISYNYTIKQENVGKRFLAQIPIKADTGKRYQVRVVARDLKRKDFNLQFIEVDKKSRYSSQNFSLLNEKNIPYFNYVLKPGSVYKIEHRDIYSNKLYVDYYKDPLPIPNEYFSAPSEETFFTDPDSTYILDYTQNLMLSFSFEGVYHFRFDTTIQEGLTIVNFGGSFPKVNTPEELLQPLAYIATKAAYSNILTAENKKLANDKFWLKAGNTTGRAREMIRIYYNRVYFANYYFSTTQPGWKTDRGMIYLVYGPPQNMEKTADSETWIYTLKESGDDLKFTFLYRPNEFNLNRYVLRRSDNHDWRWAEAMDSWRSGKIFLQD